jgi:hypothetical protein
MPTAFNQDGRDPRGCEEKYLRIILSTICSSTTSPSYFRTSVTGIFDFEFNNKFNEIRRRSFRSGLLGVDIEEQFRVLAIDQGFVEAKNRCLRDDDRNLGQSLRADEKRAESEHDPIKGG